MTAVFLELALSACATTFTPEDFERATTSRLNMRRYAERQQRLRALENERIDRLRIRREQQMQDSIDAIIKLKAAHEKSADGKYYGLCLRNGEAVDMLKQNVVEPLRVKVQAINSAAEVANMILRIDDVIASRRAPPMNPMADPSMGGPGMGGIGGMM